MSTGNKYPFVDKNNNTPVAFADSLVKSMKEVILKLNNSANKLKKQNGPKKDAQ
jgi:hypothetical protein